MSDSIKDFLVEVGFWVDTAGQAKVDTAVKQTEEKITATTTEQAKKRAAVQRDTTQERLDALAGVIKEQTGQEVTLTKATVKAHAERADKTHAIEITNAKRTTILRSEQFKQAEAFLLRFSSVVQGVGAGLAGALSAVPLGAVLVGVERTASSLSNLAIQSQRVGSSSAGIQRFMYAMGQAGVSQGEASGALEGFAAKMKTNPEGYRQALERMGVKTTGPDGKPLSYEEMLENMRGPLSRMPYNIAKVQAESFGVTGDNALNALRDQDTLGKNLGAFDDKVRGFGMDPNKMSEDARKVEQAYSNLQTDLTLINQKIQSEFFVPLINGFDSIAKWVESHPDVTQKLEQGLLAFSAVMSVRVVPIIMKLLAGLVGLGGVSLSPALLAALGIGGAKYLADNTMSNVDPWADQSAGETALRAVEPAAADRLYGKRGEQLPKGNAPHHGLGVHATPHDTRTLWQRTMPKALGGKDAPTRGGSGRSDAGTMPDAMPPTAPQPGDEHVKQREVASYIRARAASVGIDPDVAVRVAMSEGLRGWDTGKDGPSHAGDYNTSFGAYQLHYGGSGIPGMNAMGLGDDFTKHTGMDARDPKTWRAQVDFALRRAAKAGWTDWHGAANTGIGKWQGIGTYKGPVPGAAQHLPAPPLVAKPAATGDASHPYAERTFGRYLNVTRPMAARGEMPYPTGHVPGHDGIAKVEVVKQPLDPARQKLADAMGAEMQKRHELAQHIVRMSKDGRLDPAHLWGRSSHHALGYAAINSNRIHHERHGDTFHVHAKTAQEGIDAAVKVSARRGEQDKIRFGQGSQS